MTNQLLKLMLQLSKHKAYQKYFRRLKMSHIIILGSWDLKDFTENLVCEIVVFEMVKFHRWLPFVSHLLPPPAVLKIEVAGTSSTSVTTYECKLHWYACCVRNYAHEKWDSVWNLNTNWNKKGKLPLKETVIWQSKCAENGTHKQLKRRKTQNVKTNPPDLGQHQQQYLSNGSSMVSFFWILLSV
jgi:hypothetical protein